MPNISLDALDRSILKELQINGRTTNAELATRIGLSESACLRRVRILEDRGIIERYVAMVSEAAGGRPQSVFVRISLDSQESHHLKALEDKVVERPEVMECYLMTGDEDYLLRVIVKDAADYERLHRDFLTQLPGVNRVTSSFALRTVRKKTQVPLD